jgi:hypothetical protein
MCLKYAVCLECCAPRISWSITLVFVCVRVAWWFLTDLLRLSKMFINKLIDNVK